MKMTSAPRVTLICTLLAMLKNTMKGKQHLGVARAGRLVGEGGENLCKGFNLVEDF